MAITNNPAMDDSWSFSEQAFAGSLFFDVRANDPVKKALHAIDNGQAADLSRADLARSAAASSDRSALGATIWITSDGRIGYSASSISGVVDQLAAGETLTDSFLYAIKQGSNIVWATVRITITGTNDAPVATADIATASEDALTTGSVATNDRDIDHGAVLQFATVGQPPAGFVLASNGSWAFDGSNPAYQALGAGETVQLAIGYTVTDQHGATSSATLQLTVTGTNDAPLVNGPVLGSASEDGALFILDALANASDADGDALLVVNVPAAEDLPAGVTYDSSTGRFTLDPRHPVYQQLDNGQTVVVTVNYGVSDGAAITGASVSWTVTGTNDAPVVTGAVSGTAVEDGAASTLAALANSSDADAGSVLSVVGLPEELPAGVSYDPESRSFTLDPAHAAYQSLAQGAVITVSVGYGVSDGIATTPASVSWTVTGTNDGPIAAAAAAAVAEDQAVSGTLVATDADDDASLIFEPYTGGPEGFTLASDGSWTFDANQYEYQSLAEGESRELAIEYVVTDDQGETSVSTLTVTVTGTNDAPVTTSHWAEAVEGETATGALMAIDQDNGAELSFAVDGEAPAGFVLAADGSWTFDAANAAYDVLASGETRLIEVPFTVTDEHGGSISHFMIIALTGNNDAPVRSGDPVALPAGTEDTAYVVTQEQLLAGWSDPEGASLIATGVNATNATVTDNGDGSFTIQPAANFNGVLQLSYDVSDGLATTPALAQIAINAVNDAPALTGTPANLPAGTEDVSVTVTQAQLLQGWSDVEGQALSITSLGASDGARVTANANGTYSITPAANWNGTLQLSYGISDGTAATATSLSLSFAAANDLPRLTATAYVIPGQVEDTSFNVTAAQLLQGWTDVDGDSLTISTISTPNGLVTNNGDGTFTVRPATNASGTARLDYVVYDGRGTVNTSLNYSLQAVNDPAVIGGATSGTAAEDDYYYSIWGQLSSTDVDNPSNSFVSVSSAAATYGTYALSAQGRWTYFLNNANPAVNQLDSGQTLSDSFVVRTVDGTQQTVTITIQGLTDNAYVSPAVSTAADANDFDQLNAAGTLGSTQFNFYGTSASETVHGSNGNDNLSAQGGADAVYGHGGSDAIYGEIPPSNAPPLSGVAGDDTLYGQAGNDTVSGNLGSDWLYGGSGNDTLYGNHSQDTGTDTAGDYLYGGSGDDRLYGQSGDDALVGGTGFDQLYGGAGADRFVYLGAQDTGDWIMDFQRGTDHIDLSAFGLDPANFAGAIAPGYVGPGGVGFRTYQGGSQTETYIYIDTDGVAGADLEIRLIGTNGVDAGDFIW